MNIQIVRVGDVTVIAPTDVLDAVVANSIKLTLADLIESRQVRLVVDLNAVPAIDSAGLGALVGAMKQARLLGGDVRLCSLQREVHAVLVLTGLIKQLGEYPDRESAVASYGREG
jgi:anti-anti-sigma factor